MLTPEIQQYINQQRTTGVADAQIRQTLSSQGWQQADLDQAFGVAPVVGAKSNVGKIVAIVLIIFVGLPLLVWAGIGSFLSFKMKQSVINTNPSNGLTQSGSNPSPLNNSNQTACGPLPPSASSMYLTGGSNVPSGYPSDLPQYPGSIIAGSFVLEGPTAKGVNVVACTNGSLDQVANYLVANGTNWDVKNPYANVSTDNKFGQALGQTATSKILAGVQGTTNVVFNLTQNGTKTWIFSEVIINR